jgi:hypothetical protein
MDFGFRKNDNEALFESMKLDTSLNMEELQNYVPIYGQFFDLTSSNFNKFNLNTPITLRKIGNKRKDGTFVADVVNDKGSEFTRNVFFKLSPIIDPVRYMVGKYDHTDPDLMSLPVFDSQASHAKARDPNNAAYADGLFSYLTSQLNHNHKFPHGLDFYGSYLGVQKGYELDVGDDVDYLQESDFFHKHKGTLFDVDEETMESMLGDGTRTKREKLDIGGKVLTLADISDISVLDGTMDKVFGAGEGKTDDLAGLEAVDFAVGDDGAMVLDEKADTESCSSRSSHTDGGSDEGSGDEEDDDGEGSQSGSSDWSEDSVHVGASFPRFPVHVIALEKCEATLDELMADEDLGDKEWGSIMMQIIMTLAMYQKVYAFTHNDLHTNNVMYVKTDRPHITYRLGGKIYKVPTFGRLFKIIDFGRAIYKFRGRIICSDSYHPKGDAAGQYNFGPYLDESKPRLEPSYGFDLCRLGCAVYDYVIDDLLEDPTNEILSIIAGLCLDDKGNNILYKSNGDERYPGFKLYKMISRNARETTSPQAVLEKPYFQRYVVSRKSLNKKAHIINIDAMEPQTD